MCPHSYGMFCVLYSFLICWIQNILITLQRSLEQFLLILSLLILSLTAHYITEQECKRPTSRVVRSKNETSCDDVMIYLHIKYTIVRYAACTAVRSTETLLVYNSVKLLLCHSCPLHRSYEHNKHRIQLSPTYIVIVIP